MDATASAEYAAALRNELAGYVRYSDQERAAEVETELARIGEPVDAPATKRTRKRTRKGDA